MISSSQNMLGVKSQLNSTSETLAGSAEYTGTWEQNHFPIAQVWVQAAGAATLFIEFSPDGGTTVDQFPFGGITLTAGIPYYDHVAVGEQAFRIRVVDTSGSSNAIQTLVGYGNFGRPASIISTGINSQSGSINVKSVLFGLQSGSTNSYKAVPTNSAGALLSADFGTDVSEGLIDGYGVNTKFGRNSDIDTTTDPEDVWEGGGTYTGFNATAAENIEVLSSDADDQGSLVSSGTVTTASSTALIDSGATFSSDGVAAGDLVIDDTQSFHGIVTSVDSETQLTVFAWVNSVNSHVTAVSDAYRVVNANDTGAAVVKLTRLLDDGFSSQTSKYAILNGTTGVTVTGDYMRNPRLQVILAGSSGTNEGTITSRQATTTANIFCAVPAGLGQSQVCCDTVPMGETFLIKRIRFDIARASGSAGSANVEVKVRPYGEAWRATRSFELQTGGGVGYDQVGAQVLLQGTDFKGTVLTVSDNNTVVTGALEYFEITND